MQKQIMKTMTTIFIVLFLSLYALNLFAASTQPIQILPSSSTSISPPAPYTPAKQEMQVDWTQCVYANVIEEQFGGASAGQGAAQTSNFVSVSNLPSGPLSTNPDPHVAAVGPAWAQTMCPTVIINNQTIQTVAIALYEYTVLVAGSGPISHFLVCCPPNIAYP